MPDPAEYLPCEITLDFGDGEYRFRLGLKEIAELQTKCDAGIGAIYSRLMRGRYRDGEDIVLNPLEAVWKVQDISETVRLGLIGGGSGLVNGEPVKVTPEVALAMCRKYVEGRPLLDIWKIAAAIMSACIIGYADPAGAAQKKTERSGATGRGKAKAGSTTTKP
jgi:hypothetical protein